MEIFSYFFYFFLKMYWNNRNVSYICKPKTGEALKKVLLIIEYQTCADVAQLARAADL